MDEEFPAAKAEMDSEGERGIRDYLFTEGLQELTALETVFVETGIGQK